MVGRRYEWHGLLTSTYRLMYLLTNDSMTLTTAVPTDRVMVMVMIKKKAMWMDGPDMGWMMRQYKGREHSNGMRWKEVHEQYH